MPHHGIHRRFPEESILKRDQVRHPHLTSGLGDLPTGNEGQRSGDDTQYKPHGDLLLNNLIHDRWDPRDSRHSHCIGYAPAV